MPPSGRSSSSHSGPSAHSSSSHSYSRPSSHSSSSHSSYSSSSHSSYSSRPSSHSYSSHNSYSGRSSSTSRTRSSTSYQSRPYGGYGGTVHHRSSGRYHGATRPRAHGRRWPVILLILLILYAFGKINEAPVTDPSAYGNTVTQTRKTNIELFGREYYVTALGRTCRWNSQYQSYYDKETDCYFLYNNEADPAVWQYWFEGISSDYGDNGWMEWDEARQDWYIEAQKGKWIPLPDTYSRDGLWHITGN